MAKTLTGTVKCTISVSHNYTHVDGITASDPVTFSPSINIATYQLLASQGGIYHISATLASNSNISIDLNAGLDDIYGSAQVFSNVFMIFVRNTTTTSGYHIGVFGGESAGGTNELTFVHAFAAQVSGGLKIPGNGSFICLANRTTANQYAVTATTDSVCIQNLNATQPVTYQVVLIGDKA